MFKKFKGFTLVEIFIVLAVVGVISALTIPQLTNVVSQNEYKAGYKKAYEIVSNVAEYQKADGALPAESTSVPDDDELAKFFEALSKHVEAKGYVNNTYTVDTKTKISTSEILSGISYGDVTYGENSSVSASDSASNTPWIITTDGMAYTVIKGGKACKKKSAINKSTVTAEDAMKAACLVVVVDTNGLQKAPNAIETQVLNGVGSTEKLKKLTGDRYYIYIASNGAARGGILTVSGRLISENN